MNCVRPPDLVSDLPVLLFIFLVYLLRVPIVSMLFWFVLAISEKFYWYISISFWTIYFVVWDWIDTNVCTLRVHQKINTRIEDFIVLTKSSPWHPSRLFLFWWNKIKSSSKTNVSPVTSGVSPGGGGPASSGGSPGKGKKMFFLEQKKFSRFTVYSSIDHWHIYIDICTSDETILQTFEFLRWDCECTPPP